MSIDRSIRSFRLVLFALILLAAPAASFGQVAVSITVAPPELPVYEQPVCPGDGYIWTPGYWAWDGDDDDYYWVPGTWVLAPDVGFFWTPAYWGWNGISFVFYDGYWGPHVGFYGGINYGFGYFGHGYEGGRWDNGHFFYNRSVNNVNVTEIHNVYETRIVDRTVTRVSFNGGNGGINERPTREEEAATHERHLAPVSAQAEHVQAARSNRELRASSNHGKPPIAATPKPGELRDHGIVKAKEGGRYNPPARSENNATHPSTAVHPGDLPPAARPAAPNTGNQKLDQKYQQQQEKLNAKQDQDRQKLQQKQEQDHQRMAKQQAVESSKQQTEQHHEQQTQQLVQKHAQQQQKLQQRQQPSHQSQSKPPKEKP
jgi:hypothetical protein